MHVYNRLDQTMVYRGTIANTCSEKDERQNINVTNDMDIS